MLKRSILALSMLIAALAPAVMAAPAGAQEGGHELAIDVSPEAGPPDTDVTISGAGAPANAEVIVSSAVWTSDMHCRAPRDGTTVDTVTAGDDGEFSATHQATRYSADVVGYTYFAYIPSEDAPQPRSNLKCFPFEGADNAGASYFDATGHWVTDRFLEFWDDNGGLPVFGYPMSEDRIEDGRTTQIFERQRFELHAENERPFDVLLGHLGREAAEERGLLDTDPFQPAEASITGGSGDCTYFEATGHSVCNDFLDYWESYGLNLGDDGISERESIMLFGYPISEEFTDSDTGMTVQYFERAKLEYHPDNEQPWKVIPERLGAKMVDR